MTADASTDHQTAPGSPDLEMARLREEISQLKQRVAWFEKQLFGQKSEKRPIDNPQQYNLLGEPATTAAAEEDKLEITYQRGKAKKQRPEDCATDAGLRFSDDVPVEVIPVVPAWLQGDDADQYEVIDTKITHKLAQRPASYVVLRYEIPVARRKDAPGSESAMPAASAPALITAAMPDQVLDNSLADVSVLVGLLIDKFCYHLPLYRQHQRLAQAGITVARSTLTNWVKRSIELLRPIVEAMLRHILQSKVLAMDETGIKAGKQKGKMRQAWFWPIYGDADEIVFTFSESRGRQQIEDVIRQSYTGTLVTDGYAAYARYVAATEGVVHAQCWVHGRRKFVDAEASDPAAVSEALDYIGHLYRIEKAIREADLSGAKKREYRLEHSKPVVDAFFAWCQAQCQRPELTPKHPLAQALNYMRRREAELKVFLEDPDVPLDTNHLERQIRPIPMGRKNWLFCWTELGAEHVGLIQSLISTCKLQGVNPHTYLTDVLQRIGEHPASRVEELTPRLWKEHFADNPMKSVLDRGINNVVE